MPTVENLRGEWVRGNKELSLLLSDYVGVNVAPTQLLELFQITVLP